MKFETYVHKIVPDHQPNFHKDPCKDVRARGVNARTRDEILLEGIKSGKLKSGQLKLGQVKLGQVKYGQVKWG